VLWESLRSEPEIARICQRQAHLEGDLVGERVVAVRQSHLPLEAEVAAVERRRELEARPQAATGGRDRLGPRAGDLHRARDASDRQLAREASGAVVRELDGARAERHLGVVLGVEELRAEDVRAELGRIVDRDRLHLGRALEHEAVVTGGEAGRHVVERAAELAPPGVLDGKAERGMNRVGYVGAREGLHCCGHGFPP
jgi:hypothetical protein